MTNLSQITSQLTDRPYRGGSMNITDGLDCFSLIYNYLKFIGRKPEKKINGYTMDNYYDRWQDNPAHGIKTAVKLISRHTDPMPTGREVAGDILLCADEKKNVFFAIEAGNGYLLTMIGSRSQMIEKKYYNIRKVFRCRLQ